MVACGADAIPFENKKAIESLACCLVRAPLSLKNSSTSTAIEPLYRSRMNPSLGRNFTMPAAPDPAQAGPGHGRDRRLSPPLTSAVDRWLGDLRRACDARRSSFPLLYVVMRLAP